MLGIPDRNKELLGLIAKCPGASLESIGLLSLAHEYGMDLDMAIEKGVGITYSVFDPVTGIRQKVN